MADNVQTMAYAGELPWHAKGNYMTAGQDVDTWRKMAGLDWEAVANPMSYTAGDGSTILVPNQIVLTRSDNKHVLGTFSKGYKAAQPADVLSFFDDFVLADENFSMETAGVLKQGEIIWALARYQNPTQIMGEAHNQFVFLTTSYDGTLATTAQATMVRVVCNNTLTASLFDKKSATVKIRHNAAFDAVRRESALEQLQTVAASFNHYKSLAESLALVRMSRAETEKLINIVMAQTEKRADMSTRIRNQVDTMLSSLQKTINEGTEKNTAWTLLNATTRFVDHEKQVNGASNDNMMRVFSSTFGGGAAFKRKMFTAINDFIGEDLIAA